MPRGREREREREREPLNGMKTRSLVSQFLIICGWRWFQAAEVTQALTLALHFLCLPPYFFRLDSKFLDVTPVPLSYWPSRKGGAECCCGKVTPARRCPHEARTSTRFPAALSAQQAFCFTGPLSLLVSTVALMKFLYFKESPPNTPQWPCPPNP